MSVWDRLKRFLFGEPTAAPTEDGPSSTRTSSGVSHTQRRGGDAVPVGSPHGEDGASSSHRSVGGELTLDVDLETAAVGGVHQLSALNSYGQKRVIQVKVPRGVLNGTRIRIPGQVAPTAAGSRPADMFVRIRLKPHPVFERSGRDLTRHVTVTEDEVTPGRTVEIPLLTGSKVRVTIPAKYQQGTKLRVEGYGLPGLGSTGAAGDLYVILDVSAAQDEFKAPRSRVATDSRSVSQSPASSIKPQRKVKSSPKPAAVSVQPRPDTEQAVAQNTVLPGAEADRAAAPAVVKPRISAVRLSDDLLQYSDTSAARLTDAVLGFDFGTSSAKVAIQTPYEQGARTVIVDFGNAGYRGCRYLLPVQAFRNQRGEWTLNEPATVVESRLHLKLPLIGAMRDAVTANNDDLSWAVAFVALALREARRNFLTQEAAVLNRSTLRWALNFGIPSAGYTREEDVARFMTLARAGWHASLSSVITQERIDQAITLARRDDKYWASIPINVVPEVAAEMVGYARSRFRVAGLHVVLDIGASTLDVCGLELREEDDYSGDRFEMMTAEVCDLGLLELHMRRCRRAGWQPPFNGILKDIVGPLAEPDTFALQAALHDTTQQYIAESSRVLMRTLATLHHVTAPNAPAWRTGLPVFVTGGAAGTAVVEAIIDAAHHEAQRIWVKYRGLIRQPLPMDIARGPAEDARQRFAVAYGLSFPNHDIGRISPPEYGAEPHEPLKRRDYQQNYIDK
jgi:hypothetical protein